MYLVQLLSIYGSIDQVCYCTLSSIGVNKSSSIGCNVEESSIMVVVFIDR